MARGASTELHTLKFDEIVKDTGKAVLFRLLDDEKHWIPSSMIEGYNTDASPQEVYVQAWWIKKEGIDS